MKRNQPVKVRVWVAAANRSAAPPRPTSWTRFITAMMLTGAIGLIVSGSWVAVQLIVNPASVSWLSQFLPGWTMAVTPPQTWKEITAEVNEAGKSIGHPFHFSTYPGLTSKQPGFHDVLLPVLESRRGCKHSTCEQIVELRVYRPSPRSHSGKLAYDLVDRITVAGPEELAAIAPLTHNSAVLSGSTRTLPLTQIDLINGKAAEGIWLQLNGEWKRGSVVRYGQLIQYDPNRDRLYAIQAWSSSTGQLPRWQQVTGNAEPEFVVDQSIGLESQLEVYQLKPARTISQAATLEPISLTESALKDRTYLNGLLLARHGLWTPALQLLTAVKKKGTWSATAQAQLDVIALNATVTKTQADRDWASPTQQILAQVMDGRWQQALKLLKSAHTSGYDIQNLLKSNADRLWQRVEVAVRVSPAQVELQEWGALILAVKQNRSQAIAWLRQQPDSAVHRSIDQTLALLEPTAIDRPDLPKSQISGSTANASANPVSCLIGSVTPLPAINASQWQVPRGEDLASGQKAYRIAALGLCQGQQWQPSITVSNSPTVQQWQELGLTNLSLQISVWQNTQLIQQLPLTIKGFQRTNQQFVLLAVGDALPNAADSAAVAITPQTIAWVQASTSRTLNDLAQASVWKTQVIPQLWQNLQTAKLIPAAVQANDPLQTIGDWAVQQIDLTSDQIPESVLTIAPADSKDHPRTVIFSEQGHVIYSDLSQNQSLIAIANRSPDNSSILLIDTPQGSIVKQWSKQNRSFE